VLSILVQISVPIHTIARTMRATKIVQAIGAYVMALCLMSCNAFVQRTIPRCQPGRGRIMASESSTTVVDHNEEAEPDHRLIWKHLLDRFQGDFDNYEQVVKDREENLLPREGGGHENFHCTLIPVSETGRLAAFYFDGNPKRIFRFRYYELLLPSSEDGDDLQNGVENGVEMKLYTLNPVLEALLRSNSEDPLEWPLIYSNFEAKEGEKIAYLPNCEITWSLDIDPVQHSYTQSNSEDNGIHAVMVHGEAIVDSTLIPGVKIRILDQLSLYENMFYINDRGLDPESGAFIYGNQRGVPYRLERVSSLENGKRTVVNEDLRWTMGGQWRSEEEYEGKLKAAGGASVGMKPPSKS
jgi:hypothetical protein